MIWLLALVGMAADPAPVLHVGNSYTFYNDLPSTHEGLLRGTLQGADFEVVQVARGGARLSGHAADARTPGTPLADAIASHESFYVVSLQEQSQIPGLPRTSAEWRASRAAVEQLRADLATRHLVVLATWGRRDGDASLPELYPDFDTMNDRLQDGTVALIEGLDDTYVAPVGRAFSAVRSGIVARGDDPDAEGSLFRRLYSADGSHPSELGTFVAACVELGTLVGVGCDFVGGEAVSLDPADRALLAEAARAPTVDAAFGDLSWPWTTDESALVAKDGVGLVLAQAAYRPAVYIDQDLGTPSALAFAGPLGAQLHFAAGSRLDAASLTGSGDIVVTVDGGAFQVDSWYQPEGRGRLHLVDGSATVGPSIYADRSVEVAVDGGRLSLAGPIRADVHMDGGVFGLRTDLPGPFRIARLHLATGATFEAADLDAEHVLSVDGDARLEGTVSLAGEARTSPTVLIRAGSLSVDPDLVVRNLPEGWELHPTATQLVVRRIETDDTDPPDVETGSNRSAASPTLPRIVDEPGSCSTVPLGGLGAPLLILAIGLTRRRRPGALPHGHAHDHAGL